MIVINEEEEKIEAVLRIQLSFDDAFDLLTWAAQTPRSGGHRLDDVIERILCEMLSGWLEQVRENFNVTSSKDLYELRVRALQFFRSRARMGAWLTRKEEELFLDGLSSCQRK